MCNDLTKKFENVIRCNISQALVMLAGEKALLGEYVIVVESAVKDKVRKLKGNKFRPEGDADGE